MVDDARDVLVVPPVRQLVDAHVLEAVQTIGRAEPGDDALDDLADCAPRDAQQPRRRRPVHDLREVGSLVLEVAREAAARVGPGHELGAHGTTGPAVHAPLPIPQRHLHAGEVEVPPRAVAVVVHTRCSALAGRAVRHARRRTYVDHDPGVRELEASNAGVFQRQLSSE